MITSLNQHIAAQCQSLHKNVRGGATIEFCLVLPIFWFLLFLLAQTMLVFIGKLHVEYAAYAAARAAIVQIPRDDIGSGFNTISPGDDKAEAIREAAYIALVGTASQSEEEAEGSSDIDLESGLTDLYGNYGKNDPRWTETLATRLDYAEGSTSIKIKRTNFVNQTAGALEEIQSEHTFGPKDPVTIEVTHKKYLSMPYVRWIFSDEENSKQRTLKAQCTMHLEGVITTPPPTPPLPRETP